MVSGFNVRAELNEGEDKLPDDGKLHFEGVTVNATPTVIAHIPIAENESLDVASKFISIKYNVADSGAWLRTAIGQRFYRATGGNPVARTASSTLADEGDTGLDVTLSVDTSAKTVKATVTGIAATRIKWKASVEVQRISEKTYER